MVVHGKIRWTSSRCVVAYDGHAPMAKWSEFEFENESHISNSNITHVGARFLNNGGRFKFKHLVGSGTCWEESPMLAIDTKVYKRDVVSNLEGVRECANFPVFL